jgi:DNA primase
MLNPSDEIKARLDIVEVIRQYLPLKAAGTNFTGRCPFHNEKTPSFTVSPTKQVWHCFGCGKGGDLFSFIMEIEKLSFPEALRLLAPRAGVILKRETGPLASQRNRVLDALDQAARYYHNLLLTQPAGEPARNYLLQRGLKLETLKEWQIGYAPDSWDDVILYLKTKKFSDEDILLAGLSARKVDTGRFYNRFRGRVMFPLREVNGNIVGFTGRILPQFESQDKQGKYVNSPQSIVYDKSKLVFGLDRAKQAIRDMGIAILVEGQMDCITAHEAGYSNVIASSGTALTFEQVKLLQRYTNKIALAYDMDSAGRLAAERASEQTLAAEMETSMIALPEGKDPDECIRKNLEGWKNALTEAKPIMEYFVEEIITPLDLATVSDKRLALKKLLPHLQKIANTIERDFWVKKISQIIDIDEVSVKQAILSQPKLVQNRQEETTKPVEEISRSRPELLSEQLLGLLLRFPSYIDSVVSRLPIDQVVGSSFQTLYRLLVIYYNKVTVSGSDQIDQKQESLNFAEFRKWLIDYSQDTANDIQVLDRLALLVERNFFETTFEQAQTLIGTSIKELRHYYLNSRLKVVTRLIFELESRRDRSSADEERLLELLKEFKGLAEEIRQVSL